MSLPTKIRGIKQPNWTDTLIWSIHSSGHAMARVNNDWRVSCAAMNGKDAVVWHKGAPFHRKYFNTLDEALAFLDYRPDA